MFKQKLKEADERTSGTGWENKLESLRELVGGGKGLYQGLARRTLWWVSAWEVDSPMSGIFESFLNLAHRVIFGDWIYRRLCILTKNFQPGLWDLLLPRKILSVAFLMFGLYLLQFVFGPSLILCSFHFKFGSLLDLEEKNWW